MNVQKVLYYGFVTPIILALVVLAVKPLIIEDPQKRCKAERGLWTKQDQKMVCVKSKYTIHGDEIG